MLQVARSLTRDHGESNLDANTIVSLAQIGMQNGIGAVLIFGLCIGLLIWMRTRSSHVLMTRLWRLFNGKAECSEPIVNEFLNRQSAVLQFRFMTGLPARTIQQVESLCGWAKENNEDVGDVVACGRYFDLEKPGLKPVNELPGRWKLFSFAGTVMVLAAILLGALAGILSDRALLRFKSSDTWFTMDRVSAIPLLQGAGFRLIECASIDTIMKTNPGFRRNDVELICATASAGQVGPYVDTTVDSQRFISAFVSLYSLCFLLTIATRLRHVVKAKEMGRRLIARGEVENIARQPPGGIETNARDRMMARDVKASSQL